MFDRKNRGSELYNAIKTNISDFVGLSKDALHIHIGLAIFFAAILLLRKSPSSLVPWLCVLGLEVANELKDIFHWSQGTLFFDIGDSPKDLVNTMLWPTVLMVCFRMAERRRHQKATTNSTKTPSPASPDR